MNLYILLLFILLFILFLIPFNNYYKYPYPNVKILQNYDYTNQNISIFNPSIIKYKNKYICLARKSKSALLASYPWTEMVFSELNPDFHPIQWRQLNIRNDLSQTFEHIQHEDARLFVIQDRLFSLQTVTAWKDISKFKNKLNKMKLIEWDENMSPIGSRTYTEFEGIQKNWSLVRYKDKNYMITDFSPFRYYEIDIDNGYQLSNKKEIHHEHKYFGVKIYDIKDNKLKCMVHKRDLYFYYLLRFFEIDLEKEIIIPTSSDMSFRSFHGLFFQYPHHINKIDDKLIMTLGIEDRQSFVLQIKDSQLE